MVPIPIQGPHRVVRAEPTSVAQKDRTRLAPSKRAIGPLALVRRRPFVSLALALSLVAAATVGALLLRQDITTQPAAVAPDVLFQQGSDYAGINAAGFATLTLGSSGTSATLAVSGVPGAALVSLGNVLKINNQDTSQAYTVTLARSTTPNAAVNDFTITVKNGATTLVTWNAVSAAQSSSFALPANTALDVSIQVGVVDGTAVGSLGSFTVQASMVPV